MLNAFRVIVRTAAALVLLAIITGSEQIMAGTGGCTFANEEVACVTFTGIAESFTCDDGSACTTCTSNPMKACFYTTEEGQSGNPQPGWEDRGQET